MNTRLSRFLPLLLAGLLLASGCAGPAGQAGGGGQPGAPQQVTVQASEFKFEPASVTVRANQPVQVTLRNTGSVLHDWTVQSLDGQVQVTAQSGQSATGQFTPTRPGTYRIVCTQPGHEQAGMVGQLTVQ
ncbi:MAG: cupredoxin domain-containing protein [Chloroflexi bacterium]|nr:cupredoxin domain-containing protein [Chloroflexota bacterium]